MLLLGINTPKPFMTVAVGQFWLKLFCLSSGPTDDAVEDFGTFIALIPAGEMENVHCPDDRISTKQAEWFPKAFCRCSYRPLLGDYYTFSCSTHSFLNIFSSYICSIPGNYNISSWPPSGKLA